MFYDYILHDRDDDFPMAPENIDIDVTMLSAKQFQLQIKYYGATCSNKYKLICLFLPKAESMIRHYYVTHYFLNIIYYLF